MKNSAHLLLGMILSTSAIGQVVHSTTIDANTVHALITDESSFFNDHITASASYEIPAGSGKHTIYSASMWAGGLDVNNQLHLSAAAYGDGNWHSGPIADPMYYGNASYFNSYNKSIWKVTRQEVEQHVQGFQQSGYVLPSAIAEWPGNGDVSLGVAQNLAPFVDQNGNGIYEPLDGDYPDFPGDQVVYVIVNDESYQPDGNQLRAEVHMMFYQFVDAGYLNETTFLNIRTFNRSTTDYYDFHQSIYMDYDIGNYNDDYFGSDSSRNMMYGYNGDAYDESNGETTGYASNPPCQAVKCLNHPMNAATYYTNGGQFPTSDPSSDVEIWNFMNGLWADGSPMYYGGNGYTTGTNIVTTYAYSGNPASGSGWIESTADGGFPNPPGDRRGVMTVSIGDFPAGGSVCADFAFIYSDDDNDVENVQNVMQIADALQNLYDQTDVFPCSAFTAKVPENQPADFKLYPNPSHGTIYIEMENASGAYELEIHDLSGRLVYSATLHTSQETILLNESPGMYVVTIHSAQGTIRKQLALE